MNGPADVWLTIAMPGWSFQVPVNSEGRLMEVCQLTAVLNVWSKSTRRSPPGAVVSGMSNSCRALLMLSVTSKVLLQFQGPMLRGPQSNCFVKLICEVRLAVARNGLTVLVSMTRVLLE